MGIMKGKVCVITGGAGSLGLESARLMLKEGSRTMLVDKSKEVLTKAVDELGGPADAISYTVSDVSDTRQTLDYMDRTVESGERSMYCSVMQGSVVLSNPLRNSRRRCLTRLWR